MPYKLRWPIYYAGPTYTHETVQGLHALLRNTETQRDFWRNQARGMEEEIAELRGLLLESARG